VNRSFALLAATLALPLLAACGADATGTPTPVADAVSSDWCDALLTVDRQAGDPVAGTTAALDALSVMAGSPLPGTESSIEVLRSAFEATGATGEPVLIGPTAHERIDARLAAATLHDAAECGWPSVDVTAVDYGFSGLPEQIEGGPTRFRLTNTAPSELHELVVLRKHDPAMSTSDLVELGEDMLGVVDVVGGAMIESGGTSSVALDLTAGEYVAICFIPTGGDPSGAPHLAHGMLAEFSVPEGDATAT
jgi:hypothetical protein